MRAGTVVGMGVLLLILRGSAAAADDRVLSLVSDAKSYNFDYRDGQPVGLFADVLREAMAAAGWRVEFRVRPWARGLEEVRNGEADGMFSMYRIAERDRFLLFSTVPLYVAEEHVYVLKGHAFDARRWREVLRNKRIGIVNGSYHGAGFAEAEAQHLFASVARVNSTGSLVAMLEAGRIDAAFTTLDLMTHAEEEMGKREVIDCTEPAVELMPTFLAFTRKHDFTALRDAFDAQLRKMKENGRYDFLLRRDGPRPP
jgi:polar amino acid transport system substrate-binding protein